VWQFPNAVKTVNSIWFTENIVEMQGLKIYKTK
jgi:hypothetical protein